MGTEERPETAGGALVVAAAAVPVPRAAGDDRPGGGGLGDLLAAWLLTLKSEHSRAAYAADFGCRYVHAGGAYQLQRRPGEHGWLDFLDRVAVDPLAAQEVHVNLWRDHLAIGAGFKPATVARKLAAVSSFYGYLVRRRLLVENPAAFAARPDVDRLTSTTFSPNAEQLAEILAAAAELGPRVRALVSLLTFTGARVSEACGGDVEDLRRDHGMVLLRVTRKGGAVQDLPVPGPALGALRGYLGPRARGPLFLDDAEARRLDRRRALQLITDVGIRSGVSDRLTPHSLRHGYAAGAEAAGVPVTRIQQDLGHRDIRTTQRYLHASSRHQDFGGFRLAEMLAEGRRRH